MSTEERLQEAHERIEMGRKVREYRLANGLTQQALAALLGVKQCTLSNVERGYPVGITVRTKFRNFIEGTEVHA